MSSLFHLVSMASGLACTTCKRQVDEPHGLLFLQVKARVDARNALETYCYNMKQTIEDKLGDKLDEDDKDKVRCCFCCQCTVLCYRAM